MSYTAINPKRKDRSGNKTQEVAMKQKNITVVNVGVPDVGRLTQEERKRFYAAMLARILEQRMRQLSEGGPSEDKPRGRDYAVQGREDLQ